MTTNDEYLTRLSDAETALHKLMIGQQAIKLEYDGKSVTYSMTNIGDLRAYIEELKVNAGVKSGRRGASRVNFY